jgi:hypothetical protein
LSGRLASNLKNSGMGTATGFGGSGIRDEECRLETGRDLIGDAGFGGADVEIGRMR